MCSCVELRALSVESNLIFTVHSWFDIVEQTVGLTIQNRSENFHQWCSTVKRRNQEVKTSPVELGNCCQEWAGPPAVMRQHWAQLCINTRALYMLNHQTVEGLQRADKGHQKICRNPLAQTITIHHWSWRLNWRYCGALRWPDTHEKKDPSALIFIIR